MDKTTQINLMAAAIMSGILIADNRPTCTYKTNHERHESARIMALGHARLIYAFTKEEKQ